MILKLDSADRSRRSFWLCFRASFRGNGVMRVKESMLVFAPFICLAIYPATGGR